MNNTNRTEKKTASASHNSSTSHKKASKTSSKTYSSPTGNVNEEEFEIDEVSFSGGCPCRQSSKPKSF